MLGAPDKKMPSLGGLYILSLATCFIGGLLGESGLHLLVGKVNFKCFSRIFRVTTDFLDSWRGVLNGITVVFQCCQCNVIVILQSRRSIFQCVSVH